ncbi:hypothetical protein MMC25_005698 [Agyrium rufum]|nr:hypothetical protein [Agyrium rufum]
MDDLPTVNDYPAAFNQVSGTVHDVATDVSITQFSDKILVTVTQDGCLAHWLQVSPSQSLTGSTETYLTLASIGDDEGEDGSFDPLPMTHLTPVPLLGGHHNERDQLSNFYASQIASLIFTKNPEERRAILVGFGFQKSSMNREAFFDLMELVTKCLL